VACAGVEARRDATNCAASNNGELHLSVVANVVTRRAR
jgi:hypothetical protein